MRKQKRVYVVRRNTNNYKHSYHSPSMGSSNDVIRSAKVDSSQASTSVKFNRKHPSEAYPGHMIGELDRRHMVVITPSGERLHYVRGRQIPKKKTSARLY